MQPPAFSGLEEECHGTMGWAKNSEELRRTVTDSISQCKVKGISEIPLAFVNIIPSLSIFIHLSDFHESNEASNGSAEGQRLKELSPVVPLEFEICAVTKCPPLQDLPVGLHPRARRLVHPVFVCFCTRFCSLFFPSLEVCGLVL